MTTTTPSPSDTSVPRQGQEWWRSPFRMFQTNLREPDAAMDVARTLDHIEDHGADVWLVNAGGISSFYPTDLDFQTRNPYLAQRTSGDLLGDAVTAAHERGIRVMARMDFSKVAEPVAAAHEDWWFIDPLGERQVYQTLTSMCPLGAYYQHRAFDVIDEVVERYDVDGFFFNWFSFNEVDYSYRYRGVCHCAACRRAFHDASGGAPLPDGPSDATYQQWLTFSAGVLGELASAFRAHVADRAPGAGLILGRSADIVFHEANNALGREFWPFHTGEAVSGYTARTHPQPVLVNAVSFLDMPYRLAGEQPEHFALYLIQAIARGANPSTYIMGLPGDIRYPNLGAAAEVTRFHRDHHDLYDGLAQDGEIGLVRPDRLRLDAAPMREATEEYRGIYLALQETHVSFDVLSMEGMREAAAAGRYAAIVLPDLGALDADEITALDAYTRAGGAVVCTGSSAFDAEGRAQLADSPARAVETVTADAETLRNTYVADVADEEDLAIAQPVSMVPVVGTLRRIDWAPESEWRGRYVGPAPLGPPEKTYGYAVTDAPAWALRDDSEGVSIVVPFTIGRSYRETSLSVVRDLVEEIVERVRRPDIRIDAPEQVEVIRGRRAGSTVLHLVNLTGVRRQGVGPSVPVTGMRLRLSRPPLDVRSLVTDEKLKVRIDGDDAIVELPALGSFDVIVIDEERNDR